MNRFASIESTLLRGERVTRNEARWLWQNASNDELRHLSAIVRANYHAANEATWLLMRIINYTNVCVAKCDYCSFYRLPGAADTYTRSREWVFAKVDELLSVGGDFFGFNGGFNPELKIDYYTDLFGSVREKYGNSIEFYAMTVVELIYVAKISRLSLWQALEKLSAAGVRWVTGGGAEVLSDTFRKRHSPLKYTVQEYMSAQKLILESGMRTTATMVIGFDETLEERLDHLDTVRRFQDENPGGLFSFLCWTYKPWNNELGGCEIDAQEYLRHLALCRIYLDNIVNIRTSVLTQNANALKGLSFGANDFDIPWEDEVTQLAGAVIEQDVERVLAYAKAEGFIPRRRSPLCLPAPKREPAQA